MHSYYNDEWRPVEERKDAESTAAISNLWGSRHRDDLVRKDRAVGGTTLNETRYVLMDYFSPAAITDEVGDVTERYQFTAFGLRTILNPDFTVRSSSECAMEFAFQGQFEDVETGWLNYGYRYFLPALGRWDSKDPIGEDGGLNLYKIVGNDTVNLVDYLGLERPPGEMPHEDPPSDGNFLYMSCAKVHYFKNGQEADCPQDEICGNIKRASDRATAIDESLRSLGEAIQAAIDRSEATANKCGCQFDHDDPAVSYQYSGKASGTRPLSNIPPGTIDA